MKRFGKGPNGERDMDVDSEEEPSDDDYVDGDGSVSMVELRARVLGKGFSESQLMNTIAEVRSFSHLPDFLPQGLIDRVQYELICIRTSSWQIRGHRKQTEIRTAESPTRPCDSTRRVGASESFARARVVLFLTRIGSRTSLPCMVSLSLLTGPVIAR